MKAAIYARKSTDQSGVADEAKSVHRQIEHARQYAARKGWAVDEAYVFVDDGISGAEFARRPGYLRLMNALAPHPPFDVLVMSEESRLGRESIEVSHALKQIVTAGVRVFFYLEDRERTLNTPIEKMMLALQTMTDEMERSKAGQRSRDKGEHLARAGKVAGGKCFGYDNVRVGIGGQHSHVEQRINEAEAAVVRRIFELAATGMSQLRIAMTLNAEGLPAPRSQQGRPKAWAISSVHEALYRARYRGELVWNTTQKRDQWGQRRVRARPAEEWIRVPAPHLQIIPEALWDAAHARIAANRTTSNVWRGPERSVYLLTGHARCACCGGGMHVRTRTTSRTGQPRRFYACTSHFGRGPTVCQNNVQVPMGEMDAAVLQALGNILSPAMTETIIDEVRQALAPDARVSQRDQLAAELARLDTQAEHLAEAIAMGGNVPALVAKLTGIEKARQAAQERLDAMDGPVVPRIDWRVAERQARRLLADWRRLLERNTAEAREVIAALMPDPIVMTPIAAADARSYRFEGRAELGGFLAGTVRVTSVVSPGRIELPA